MENSKRTQSEQIETTQQFPHRSDPQTQGVVWPDNPTPHRVRAASPQPVPPKNTARTHRMETKSPRGQKRSSQKRRTVQVSVWVKPGVKDELERIAKREQISLSATAAAFLEKAIESDLHTQHEALYAPILRKELRQGLRASDNRLVMLLLRDAYASEQTRAIVTNILRLLPGVTPDALTTILDESSKTAKRNILRRTPQLEALMHELENIFSDLEQ